MNVADDVDMFDWKLVGKKYRSARKRLGLNQTEMAERADIAQTTLSNIENGRTTTTATLSALAMASGLELTVDLHPVGESPPTVPPEMLEAVRALGGLSPSDRQAFIELMRTWPHLPGDLRAGTLAQWGFYCRTHGTSGESSRSTA